MFDRYQSTGRFLLAGTIASLGILSTATSMQDAPVIPVEVEAWRADLWKAAIDGNDELVEAYLASIPATADPASMATLKAALLARDSHDAQSVDDRDEGRRKAIEELEEKLEASEITGALTAAVRLQTLSDDWDAVLDQERIMSLITRAEAVEDEARAEGDWLQVQEILFRLRTLHEDTAQKATHKRYDDQLEEVNRRIGLLARYAPRSLYELRSRNMARLEPETEFPEFNEAFAEDWKEALNGISERMVRASLRIAASEHVSNCGWKPLLDGGLEAVEIFSTTDQLVENFPGLADPAKVDAWRTLLTGERARLEEKPDGEVSRQEYHQIMRALIEGNRETINIPEEIILREFAEGATYRLEDVYEDQYTQVIWPEQLRRFQQQVQGDFVGVGVMIRHDDKREIMIVNPLEGSPASRGGVEENDRIIAVNGIPTTGWSLTRAVDEITGPKGEEVMLTLRREEVDDPIEVPLVRDRIKMRSVNGWYKKSLDDEGIPTWDWYVDPDEGIGYIRLTSFNEESFNDFLVAVDEMRAEKTLRGLVLDLRFNPGGLLDSAIRFSNLFVDAGEIVSCEDRDGIKVWSRPATPQMAFLKDLPLVVLVNQGSASASEIVSGCLDVHGAAVVVGDRTFGKGSVQSLHDVSDQSGTAALKLTTQYYALPALPGETRGRLVHKTPGDDDWGVNPDIDVSMTPEQNQKAYEIRREADLIADWDLDRDLGDRPNPSQLIEDGIDAQLEMGLLILRARLLEAAKKDGLAAG
ncbi:MAG: S41 family peptidase [Planctomycetota bacterium]|nr:S41 family peptidase [Planctomycetota bacterium]